MCRKQAYILSASKECFSGSESRNQKVYQDKTIVSTGGNKSFDRTKKKYRPDETKGKLPILGYPLLDGRQSAPV